jgi:hypothetical protein
MLAWALSPVWGRFAGKSTVALGESNIHTTGAAQGEPKVNLLPSKEKMSYAIVWAISDIFHIDTIRHKKAATCPIAWGEKPQAGKGLEN